MKERKTFYINKSLADKLRSASFYEHKPQSEIVEMALSMYIKGLPFADRDKNGKSQSQE